MPSVYKPTDFQKHLWRYHKMTNTEASTAEREGEQRYESFGEFSEEVYHRMYAEKPTKLEAPKDGADVFLKLHEMMDNIPELDNFRKRCEGNERWSGIGTSSVLDTLLSNVEKPEEQIQDLQGAKELKEYFERLLKDATDEESIAELEKLLKEHMDPENPNSLPSLQKTNSDAAKMIDESAVRNAIRSAVKTANEQIDTEENLLDSFSVGLERNAGKKARMNIHKQLAKIVAGNDRLKRIAELAGRLRRIALEQQTKKPLHGTEEVTGIELGNNLSKMIPAEVLYMDDEIETVFANKLHECSLAQFELSKTPKKEQGPIVMLIDSSGSMSSGDADVWAAAVSLAFLEIAFRQKRAFAMIHFGSSTLKVEIFDQWANINREKLLETVSYFASDGGTNFMEPLTDAVKIIRDTGSFNDADIVMVTDGCASITDTFLKEWNEWKSELCFNCYSILVGNQINKATNKRFSDEVVCLSQVLMDDSKMHKFFQSV